MEIFDVVDKEDNIIDKATRDECHSNQDLIHRTVHFTLIDKKNRKIFLTQRSLNKQTDPGKLCFLGEHILTGESWNQGLIRGLKEELELTAKDFKEMSHNIFTFPNQTEFVRFFVVEWNNEDIKYDKHEIIDVKWLSLETLIKERSNYSDMTKFWVDYVIWDKVFSE